MFNFALAIALAGGIAAQEAAKKIEPIMPDGEKLFLSDAMARYMKSVVVNTPRGPRIQVLLNGQTYHVVELIVKADGRLVSFTTDSPDARVLPKK